MIQSIPLALFRLPCSIHEAPPTLAEINANRALRVLFLALHCVCAIFLFVVAFLLLRDGISGTRLAALLGSTLVTALSLALNVWNLREAAAPLESRLLAPLAALCDSHRELDAYRRAVISQGRFFCAEEFPMMQAAALYLGTEPAFRSLYLIDHESDSLSDLIRAPSQPY